ncbi:spermatogenesis-associated serine-rich protein 1-like [Styela clava]
MMTQVETRNDELAKVETISDVKDVQPQENRKGHGRLYIPHGRGEEDVYKPHAQHIDVEYSECGPDWSSMIRWLPPPSPGKKPKETTFYPPLERLRRFPDKSNVTTSKEYQFYPPHGIPLVYSKGKVTTFDSVHLASQRTYNEITDIEQFGRKGFVLDTRDGYPSASAGDKPYRIPEYSPNFHKFGSTRPVVNFGGFKAEMADTFIPLQALSPTPVKPYTVVEAEKKKQEEVNEVESLNQWRPASPLQVPIAEWR